MKGVLVVWLALSVVLAIMTLIGLLQALKEERMKAVEEGGTTMTLVLDFGTDHQVETEDQMFWSMTDKGDVIHIRGCHAHEPAHEGRWLIVKKEGNRILLQRIP